MYDMRRSSPRILIAKLALGYGYGTSSELMLPGLMSAGVGTAGAAPRCADAVETTRKKVRLARTKSFMSAVHFRCVGDDAVPERAQTFDCNLDGVAGLQRNDRGRNASLEDITGLERHAARDVGND